MKCVALRDSGTLLTCEVLRIRTTSPLPTNLTVHDAAHRLDTAISKHGASSHSQTHKQKVILVDSIQNLHTFSTLSCSPDNKGGTLNKDISLFKEKMKAGNNFETFVNDYLTSLTNIFTTKFGLFNGPVHS